MTLEQLNELAIFYFDWMVKNMLVPGKIETWLVILDLQDVGMTNIPVSRLKVFIKAIQASFPGRLYKLLVLNGNWLIRAFFATLYPFFDQYTK